MPSNLDGAGFYRCLLPARELARRGWDARMLGGEASTDGFHTNVAFDLGPLFRDRPDVVVLQMPLDSAVPGAVRRLKRAGVRVVVELDDDFTCLPRSHPAWEATSPVKHPARNRAHLFEAVRLADAVSVSTPALARSYGELNRNVSVIRNRLDWRMWVDVPQQSEAVRRRTRIGWLGVMNRRVDDLEVLRPWLRDWLLENPDVEFVAAGDPSVHDFLGVPDSQRVSTAQLPFSLVPRNQADLRLLRELPAIVACMDIGLVPLAPGRFNEGKSHLKGMEYAACGIPCVASASESYAGWWLSDGVGGVCASTEGEWRAALDVLVGDALLRRGLGRAARQKASEHSCQEHVTEWQDFFEGVCADRDRSGARTAA